MILQSLVDLYERRCASEDPEQRLSEPGWEDGEIDITLVLNTQGKLIQVHDLRRPNKRGKFVGRPTRVPEKAPGRTSKPGPNLLWDKAEFVLGMVDPKAAEKDRVAAAKRAASRFKQFKDRIEKLAQEVPGNTALSAVLAFLDHGPAEAVQERVGDDLVAEIAKGSLWLTFSIDDAELFAFADREVAGAVPTEVMRLKGKHTGQCLATGRIDTIARLNTDVDGTAFSGGQISGIKLVSFNAESFTGYGFDQGDNAPIGTYADFAYATALKALLDRDSWQRAQAGTVTVVFWAGRASPNEQVICPFLANVARDDPARGGFDLQALYAAPVRGARPCTEDDTPFLILGLSAESKSRLTARFFHQGTIKEAARNIVAWHDTLHIAPEDGPPLSIYNLLRNLAVGREIGNAPALLGAELLRCAYTGSAFPQRALAEALGRCAAEQGPTRERAALIKAFLIRNCNRRIPVELDPDEADTAYRLGRLFAVLEWVQEHAVNAKAGIAERYWGSASTTPAFVFADLLNLTVHHLAKLDDTQPGFATNRRKEIEAIVARPAPLPAKLPTRLELVDQGSFALGYWQQRAARRSSADKPVATDGAEKDAA